ncbi:MAG TPA: sigma-70 family RNA polymerase sigma factor [Candidatus Eremiobacteraceae bacterium]
MDRFVTQQGFDDFEHLMRGNQRVVYQIAYSVLGNADDAEDVTQDAFVRAYSKLTTLREPERFRAWICQIVRRLALNHMRSQKRARRREELASSDAAPAANMETSVENREFQARIRFEIERLPEKLREVLLLCAIQGLEASVVGEMLRIPEGTVRSRLHLARKQLLRALST